MAITLARAGANSAVFLAPSTGTIEERTLTNTHWETLPRGFLKDFLSRRFVDGSGNADPVAFMQATGEAGFNAVGITTPQGATAVPLRLSEGPTDASFPLLPAGVVLVSVPNLGLPGLPDWAVHVSVPYSASE